MMNPIGSLNNFVFNKNSINIDSQPNTQKPEIQVKDSQTTNASSKQSISKDKDTETDYSKNTFEDELQNEEDSLKPKDKKTSNLKNKLEDLNDSIDLLLIGLLPAPVQATVDTNPNIKLELNIDPNAQAQSSTDSNAANILATLADKLTDKSETLIKDIANIDLSSESAIQDILKLSDSLEKINALQAKLANLSAELNIETNTETNSNVNEPELNLLLDDKLEKFIDKHLESSNDKSEPIISTEDDSSLKVEAHATSESSSDTDASPEDTGNSANTDSNNFLANNTSIKFNSTASSSENANLVRETVNVNKLTKFLTDRIVKVESGHREEILMKLTPGDMGEVKLSIARQGDKLEIKMEFSNQDSMDSVEHRLNELQISLRAKGFDTEIKVSSSQSSDLNSDHGQQQQQNSFNEAKDEQKEKYLHTVPSWLRDKESDSKLSFQETLGGIE